MGLVLEICEEDCTIHVSLMVKCEKIKGRNKWPVVEDTLWVAFTDIVQVVHDPTQTISIP